ncbi:MAG: 30S ribosomal protein S5 [Cyanobacteria bacterium P01_H01_bin.74]
MPNDAMQPEENNEQVHQDNQVTNQDSNKVETAEETNPEGNQPSEAATADPQAAVSDSTQKTAPESSSRSKDPANAPGGRRGRGRGSKDSREGGRGRKDSHQAQPEDPKNDFKEKVIQIRRVTKVVKGGKKLSFRAIVVVGNSDGQVGLGVGKSNEVVGAIQKAVASAKKNLVTVPFHKTTIPHPVTTKVCGSIIVIKPASEGTGVIAGGSARAVLDLSGIGDILCKSLGSSSPLNTARATIQALSELRSFQSIAADRGKTVKEILF